MVPKVELRLNLVVVAYRERLAVPRAWGATFALGLELVLGAVMVLETVLLLGLQVQIEMLPEQLSLPLSC
jgi:hypothetical protein